MSGFFAGHAGLIELLLFEGVVVAIAAREWWSVRDRLRGKGQGRPPEPPPEAQPDPPAEPSAAREPH